MIWEINSFGYSGKAINVGDSVILKIANGKDIRFKVEVTSKKGNNYRGKILEIDNPFPSPGKYDIQKNQIINFCFNHIYEVKRSDYPDNSTKNPF